MHSGNLGVVSERRGVKERGAAHGVKAKGFHAQTCLLDRPFSVYGEEKNLRKRERLPSVYKDGPFGKRTERRSVKKKRAKGNSRDELIDSNSEFHDPPEGIHRKRAMKGCFKNLRKTGRDPTLTKKGETGN